MLVCPNALHAQLSCACFSFFITLGARELHFNIQSMKIFEINKKYMHSKR